MSHREKVEPKKPSQASVIFTVGERVRVKGGIFRIHTFGKKFMVLEAMPGTTME